MRKRIKKGKDRIFNPHPIVLKDKACNIEAKPFGIAIRGEFIHKDRIKDIIRLTEGGIDYAIYYIRKKMNEKKC